MDKLVRRSGRGYGAGIVFIIGLMLMALLMGVTGIDFAYYFAHQNQLQTSSEAGALAGAAEFFEAQTASPMARQDVAYVAAEDYVLENYPTTVMDEDVLYGFYDFYTGSGFNQTPSGSEYAFTGGYNSIQVAAWAEAGRGNQLPTIMARLFGENQMETAAAATAALDDRVVEVSGLRPVYSCQNQWDIAASDFNLQNDMVRIYGDRFLLNGEAVTCPLPAPGNWGFSDLRDCKQGSPGQSDTRQWFKSGFRGYVKSGQCYSTQPGNFIASISDVLDGLIANGTVITIPLIDTFNGSGSNTNVNVSGFTGFVITGYQGNGPAKDRYIEGYFTTAACTTCNTDETAVSSGGSVAKLLLVNPDGF